MRRLCPIKPLFRRSSCNKALLILLRIIKAHSCLNLVQIVLAQSGASYAMARKEELFSPEIMNRGVEQSGQYAGSPSFSVKVHRSLPDFLSSVKLKYVKLGYGYLINHGIHFIGLTILLIIFGAQVGNLSSSVFSSEYYILLFLVFFCLSLYVSFNLIPRSTYLVDFSCYLPPNEHKVCIYVYTYTFL